MSLRRFLWFCTGLSLLVLVILAPHIHWFDKTSRRKPVEGEALLKHYEAELAWQHREKTAIDTTMIVLGGACVGSLVLRHVPVAVWSCPLAVGMVRLIVVNREAIEDLEARLSELKQ